MCVANIDSHVLREGECPAGGAYCPRTFSASTENKAALRAGEDSDSAWVYSEEWAGGGGHVGLLGQYGGGGYGLRLDAAGSRVRLRELQSGGWLDRDTRMAAVEWWVNAPAAATALRCALTIEAGPSGAWEPALTIRGWGGEGEGARAVLLALAVVLHGWWAAWYAWRYHRTSVWCSAFSAAVRCVERVARCGSPRPFFRMPCTMLFC